MGPPKYAKSSRKGSKLDVSDKWLESDLTSSNRSDNPLLNTSYEDLSERDSEEETSPERVIDDLEEFA